MTDFYRWVGEIYTKKIKNGSKGHLRLNLIGCILYTNVVHS